MTGYKKFVFPEGVGATVATTATLHGQSVAALLAQCPPSVATVVWEAAIYDAADLFGFWGRELDRLRWPAGSLLDVPHGLIWFLKGQHVLALGAERAFTQTGRVFDRKRQ